MRRQDQGQRKDHDEPLQRQIDTLRRQIHDLQDDSPTPDAKAIRLRFQFIERRLTELERVLRVIHLKPRAEDAPNVTSAPSVHE
jgi:hypothetical protein